MQASKVKKKRLHAGDADRMVPPAATEKLAAAFVAPTVVRHARGHVVPKLEAEAQQQVEAFLAAAQMRSSL